MIICSILVERRDYFVEANKEMTENLRQDFSALNEANRKNVIEMTKFLILTQNTIVPGLLEEKGSLSMVPHGLQE
jgi:hypothetical protein